MPFADPPGAADRGERLAGDPLRARRRAARPRARTSRIPAGGGRSSGCWTGARRSAPSSGSTWRCRRCNGAQRQRRMIDTGLEPARGLRGRRWPRRATLMRPAHRGGDQMSTGEGDPSGTGQAGPRKRSCGRLRGGARRLRVEHVLLEQRGGAGQPRDAPDRAGAGHRGRARPRPGPARDRVDPGAAAAARAGRPGADRTDPRRAVAAAARVRRGSGDRPGGGTPQRARAGLDPRGNPAPRRPGSAGIARRSGGSGPPSAASRAATAAARGGAAASPASPDRPSAAAACGCRASSLG